MANTGGKVKNISQMMIGQRRVVQLKMRLGQEGASAMVVYNISCIYIHAGPNRQ